MQEGMKSSFTWNAFPAVRSLSLALPSDEYDRLRTGNLKTPAAPHILADQHIVDSHHVVARLLESRTILLIRATRQIRLLRSFQPAHLILLPFAAMGAAIRGLLRFLSLVKEVLFVHIDILPQKAREFRFPCSLAIVSGSIGDFAKLAEVTKAVDARFMSVTPAEIQCIPAHQAQISNRKFL